MTVCALLSVAGCNRQETARESAGTASPDAAAAAQQERARDLEDLQKRTDDLQQKWTSMQAEVRDERRAPTAALQAEVKEDVANARQAVANLGTTTPETWWERHERALESTADDIEADVRRLAKGRVPAATSKAEPNTTGGFEARRDAFVARLRTRVDGLEDALKDVKASGPTETEVQDTRARIDKLQDDLDRLRSVSPDDWWNVSVKRVREYVDRVAESVGRLDNDRRPSE